MPVYFFATGAAGASGAAFDAVFAAFAPLPPASAPPDDPEIAPETDSLASFAFWPYDHKS